MASKFKTGDSALVTFWGETRAVQVLGNSGSGVVHCRFVDSGRKQWFHEESLRKA